MKIQSLINPQSTLNMRLNVSYTVSICFCEWGISAVFATNAAMSACGVWSANLLVAGPLQSGNRFEQWICDRGFVDRAPGVDVVACVVGTV